MNASRLDTARQQNAAAGEWYRSPLVLLAGLILVAGLIAVLVTSLGGDDDTADGSVVEVGAPVAAADAPAFGGASIPEVDDVVVEGDALPAFDGAGDDPALGMTAPVTTATSLASGTPVTLDTGTARVIGFVAHWCPHCQAELPELTEWLGENRLPANTEFIAVSTAVSAERGNYPPSAWFNAEGWPAPVLVDDAEATLLNTYGFTGFPAFIAIDANGVVVDRIGGNVGVEGFERLVSSFAGGATSG